MPVVTEDHRAAQRARIHAATIEVLRAKGMSRLAIADIIAASGMSAGAIYGYFRGKDDLVYSLAEWLVGGRLDALRAATASRPVPPPDEALQRLFDDLPDGFVGDGLVLQLWAEAVTNQRIRVLARRMMDELYDAAADYLTAWLSHEQGMPADTAQHLAVATAPAMVALAQGYIVQGSLIDGFQCEAFLPSIRALTRAMAGEPGAPGPTRPVSG